MNEPLSNLLENYQGELLIIDGGHDFEEPRMFERVIYFSVFYCLCYVKERSIGILEEQVS